MIVRAIHGVIGAVFGCFVGLVLYAYSSTDNWISVPLVTVLGLVAGVIIGRRAVELIGDLLGLT